MAAEYDNKETFRLDQERARAEAERRREAARADAAERQVQELTARLQAAGLMPPDTDSRG